MIGLFLLFMFLIINWLVNKRSDFLISRGSRDKMEHFKIILLSNILVLISFTVSYILYKYITVSNE